MDDLKDNQIAEVVNTLRDIAVEFHSTQQLRERIAHVIVPLLSRRAVPQANAEQDAQDKIDAERYRAWRLAVITGDEEMVDRVADALPNSEDEYPTAEQWDAAVDAAIRAASKTTPASREGE